jgi:hypothetical protein
LAKLKRTVINKYLNRFIIVTIISLVMVLAISEIAFLLQKDKAENRAPQTITLMVPQGTAEQIAAGEEIPSIPEEMIFMLGDILEVKNEDDVTHQLGPLYVPANTTASLPLNEADNFSLFCSFQKTNYLGLDVREPTTIATRFLAMLAAGPPTIIFFYLNSLLIFPIKSKEIPLDK